jgi:hypothetical protein
MAPWLKTVKLIAQAIILFKYGYCLSVIVRSCSILFSSSQCKNLCAWYFKILHSVLIYLSCTVVILGLIMWLLIHMRCIYTILLVFILCSLTFGEHSWGIMKHSMLGNNKTIVRDDIIFSYSFTHLEIYYCHIVFSSVWVKEKIWFHAGNFCAFCSLLVLLKCHYIFNTATAFWEL